jgi:hypothetical protein
MYSTAQQQTARYACDFLGLFGFTVSFPELLMVLNKEWYGRARRHSPEDDAELADVLAEIVTHSRAQAEPMKRPGAVLTAAIRRYHVQTCERRGPAPRREGVSPDLASLLAGMR